MNLGNNNQTCMLLILALISAILSILKAFGFIKTISWWLVSAPFICIVVYIVGEKCKDNSDDRN